MSESFHKDDNGNVIVTDKLTQEEAQSIVNKADRRLEFIGVVDEMDLVSLDVALESSRADYSDKEISEISMKMADSLLPDQASYDSVKVERSKVPCDILGYAYAKMTFDGVTV